VTLRGATTAAAITLPLAFGACGSDDSGSSASGEDSTSPTLEQRRNIDPANFVRTVDNPYYPLRPGTVYRYRGITGKRRAFEVLEVTHRTKAIQGVETTVLHDRNYVGGRLAEDTLDWYGQDRQGNVWYFGEDTRQIGRDGKPKSTAGSWEAGKDGAVAGIFMPAKPKLGQTLQQEYYKGHAEDFFKVIDLAAPVEVPYVTTDRALKTYEWTPLEPGAVADKYYVRGIGKVREGTVKGEEPERLDLVSVKGR
jgi:hypothetical protein